MNNSQNLSEKNFLKGVIIRVNKRYIFYSQRTIADMEAIQKRFTEVYGIEFEPIKEVIGSLEEINQDINLLNQKN